jgi:hypothetical protein
MKKIKINRSINHGGKMNAAGDVIEVGDKYADALIADGQAEKLLKQRSIDDKTVVELNEMAKNVDLKGYSTMSKKELLKELKKEYDTKELKEPYETK